MTPPSAAKTPTVTNAVQPAAKQPPALAICMPSFSTIMADTAMALSALTSYTVNVRAARVALCNQKASMITMARNDLVSRSLDLGADYILFVDSDLTFPPDAAVRLMGHGRDIVGATYSKRVPPFETLGKLKGRWEDFKAGGLCPAEFLPGGFLMIKADVFRKVPWPWFHETMQRPGGSMDSFIGLVNDSFMLTAPAPVVESLRANAELQKWLDETWPLEPANKIVSEDYNFSKKARQHGYDIWCDLTLTWKMAHIGEQAVRCDPPKDADVPRAEDGSLPPDPATPARPPSIITV